MRKTGLTAPGSVASSRPVRFVILSGIGWLADTTVLLFAVSGGLPTGIAAVLGALTGSAFAFTTSRSLVFGGRGQRGYWVKLAVYLGYSLLLALLIGASVAVLAGYVASIAAQWRLDLGVGVAPFVAKIIVTPLALLLNYLVARWLIVGGQQPL